MCRHDVRPDGSAAMGSGGSRTAVMRNHARLHFRRYNYVIYQNIGANLEDGFLSFLSGLFNGRNGDFYYIDPTTPDNLNILFNVSNPSGIPSQYRSFESSAYGRFIYLFTSGTRNRDKVTELEYRGANDWTTNTYEWPDAGALRAVRTDSSTEAYFTMDRGDLSHTIAIALPGRLSTESIENIFTGSFYTSAQTFCRLEMTQPSGGVSAYDLDIYVFDPAHIIAHSVDVISYHTHLMSVVDARETHPRLSSFESRLRKRGILACMVKQLVDSESSLQNDANRSRLNSAFDRFANYGHRKAKFIDNLYNFLNHNILTNLERGLMEHRAGNVRPDGAVWLQIVAPLASIAGDHILLSYYFNDSAGNSTNESAWATFFKTSRRQGNASESATANAWNQVMGTQDYLKLAIGVAESRAYHLVTEHTAGNMTWEAFNQALDGDRRALNQLPASVRRTGTAVRTMRSINKTFSWAGRLGRLKAVFSGEVTTSTFTAALDSLTDLADSRGAAAIAVKASAIKNMIDVISNSRDFAARINVDDYDAALGHGLAIAAGLTEIGYLVATGTTLGGPVGAAVAIVGSVGAIIVLLATDSDLELFVEYSIWGTDPRGSTGQPDWAVTAFNRWTDDDAGVDRMLGSLLNLLHKFDVKHTHDTIVHVVAIEIDTKFLPDAAIFQFRGQFGNSAGQQSRVSFNLRFPSRQRRHYTRLTVRQTGASIITGANVQVVTEGGKHTIKLNLGVTSSATTGEAWIRCLPFGHREFTVPHGDRAFHLERLVEHTGTAVIINRWRDYDFESDEWGRMPSWT
ncbi:MAG: hypothetical protein CVT49_00185 [candidate division Zixibacteria bacterium HGW-Zixibacteria-1]|nr:MAG: hypothetical protein CVT49_00185 [candidate division Zixibacteria bacterium HGW-Zixibacteria-1]